MAREQYEEFTVGTVAEERRGQTAVLPSAGERLLVNCITNAAAGRTVVGRALAVDI